ncbi:hypothetical protein T265_07480 [Opisthorchis viverrini]|uniref:Uncharacterized protein n=1 Tax=Opisthorchis viverrini TaxID=6198 RepID=A0A075ABF1_OPIVI|nr:hypothetical protein T265_07480 [Opisthorchis viverrini]KER24974.1 hypothetical protein T265_07480 [Opisthorchis viverrini]
MSAHIYHGVLISGSDMCDSFGPLNHLVPVFMPNFRESRAHDLLSDDSTDTSSDAESSSGHSQASLGLEDVD